MSNSVLNVLRPVMSDLGAAADPDCWVQWGEEPQIRYLVMVPTRAGLISTAVRVNTGPDGPRATGKLIRWARLQLSELSVESAGGHRVVAVQVEGQVLKGMDTEADRICEFVRGLIAAVDGRDWQLSWDGMPSQSQPGAPQRSASSKTAVPKTGARADAKPDAKPAPKAAAAPKAASSRSAAKASPAPKPAAKPAGRKRPAATALIRALGPGAATHPIPEPAPAELTRIAPHQIFAPVSTPPARGSDAEPEDWGGANSEDRADREIRRPKSWTP